MTLLLYSVSFLFIALAAKRIGSWFSTIALGLFATRVFSIFLGSFVGGAWPANRPASTVWPGWG